MRTQSAAVRKVQQIRSREISSRLSFEELIDAIADRIAARLQIAPQSPRRLLTLREAGEMIGRSAGAVGQLVKRGELRAVQCGRRVHIEVSEIEGWIDRCRV